MPQLRLLELRGAEGLAFAAMTFPAYRHLLALAPRDRRHDHPEDRRDIRAVAVGAYVDGRPAGLALAEVGVADREPAEILSLYVAAPWRQRGVAARMLAALEEAVRSADAGELVAVYMTGKPAIAYVERLFASAGYEPPQPRMITCKFHATTINSAPWLHKYKPRSGYQIVPWAEVSAAEKTEIVRSDNLASWIPADLRPWKHEQGGFEPLTSCALKLDGRVVGWIINHALDATTLRYTCSFVRADLARLGRILPLYRESFARMLDSPYTVGMFTTPLQHEGMVNFARHYFQPYSFEFGETRGVRKALTKAPTRPAH